MSVVIDIVFVVIGIGLIAVSRTAADHFKIDGEHDGAGGTMIRMAGLYDDYVSRLYRWTVSVLTGLVFIGIGTIDLVV